ALLNTLQGQMQRLRSLFSLPFFFMSSWSHSLQNYIHYLYDLCDSFEVFQLLLVTKMSTLRQYANNQIAPPENLCREIELVYAPMAESKGYIDLASNMRDMVCRLLTPKEYTQAQHTFERAVGMAPSDARAHLTSIKETIKSAVLDLADDPSLVEVSRVEVSSRVKEISSLVNKKLDARESIDFLGIKFYCNTEKEAYAIAEIIKDLYDSVRANDLPAEKEAYRDCIKNPLKTGWKGLKIYLYDPTQKESDGKRRIIAVQILTHALEKEGKYSKIGHWSYKAEAAAKRASTVMGSRYVTQIFDPAPLENYSGDPEKDFKTDRDYAKQYLRIFVFPELLAPNDKLDLNTSFAILRFPAGMGYAIADAAGFRFFEHSLTEIFHHAELVTLGLKDGDMQLIPFKNGQTRVNILEPLPNGAFVIFRTGDALSPEDLRDIQRTARSKRAKLLAGLKLSKKPIKALAAEGKESSLAASLSTPDKIDQIRDAFELDYKNEDEVWAAIALGLITQTEIDNALKILTVTVTMSSSKEKQDLTIQAPDRIGLTQSILQLIGNGYQIVSAWQKRSPRTHVVAGAEIGFRLRPGHNKETPPIDVIRMQETLQSRQDKLRSDCAAPPTTTNVIRFEISLTRENASHWVKFPDIIAYLNKKGFNILELSLPERKAGKMIVEKRLTADESFNEEELRDALLKLGGDIDSISQEIILLN
ncbi:MAG: hypothetical protein WCT39_03985, partial [Candidatus Margulisiibacteriota bacterium]